MFDAPVILLSVRSPHVERLLDGTKTVELRRRPINVEPGTVVLLYAARDSKAVVGSVTVARVEAAAPEAIWKRHRDQVGITRTEFDSYFAGATVAHALVASNPKRLPKPINLDELRRRWKGFSTPQTHRRIGSDEFTSILNGERRYLR